MFFKENRLANRSRNREPQRPKDNGAPQNYAKKLQLTFKQQQEKKRKG